MNAYPRPPNGLEAFAAIVERAVVAEPGYLDASPYPPQVRRLFAVASPPAVEAEAEGFDPAEVETWEDIARQSKKLFTKLERLSIDTSHVSDSLQIIKTQAALLERLLGIGEKASEIREIAEFRRIVLNALADVMTADQRNDFMAQLEKF